ncbi:hypothetical protein GIB67_032605 [Kingdonia uniflora]|uniref:Uncharacterized protein n=1 Tax=Kingdonia uniflora TaxID=39325 RepID=A0A7J7LUS8_9MAGN|nr:hypothetical protein GIB67_032605 [Kingdonia uniflora]
MEISTSGRLIEDVPVEIDNVDSVWGELKIESSKAVELEVEGKDELEFLDFPGNFLPNPIDSDVFKEFCKIKGGLGGVWGKNTAATNALELGRDGGDVDATLHLGFHGSVSSLWQQAGRSGRREKPSLAVYVAFDGPLDQYFMKFPQKLFGRPIECCHIDAQNKQVYEGAIYMHQGKTYLVNALDLSGKVALCQEADLKYYTKTRDYTDIHVIGGDIVRLSLPIHFI